MQIHDNPMRRQVMSLPDLIETQYEDLEPKTRTVLSFQEIFNVQRIVLTGCGDSFAACMAEKYAFEALAGIPAEAVPALELARYYDEKQLGVDCRNPLVIAVSNSGNVSRVAEAAARARKHGAYVLGVTGHPESALGQNSDKVLHLAIPSFESAPGTRSYLVSVMALLLLAIRFGEVRMRYTMDEAMCMRDDIRQQGEKLRALLPGMDEVCAETAEKWAAFPCFEFVGGGADYAGAWFGHAKILEAAGRFATAVNVEDWFHLNYFLRDTEHTGTVLLAGSMNPAKSRIREFLQYAGDLGRPLIVITDGETTESTVTAAETEDGAALKPLCAAEGGTDHRPLCVPEGTAVIRVPSAKYPMTLPLTHFVPLCLFAGELSELLGESYGRGSEGLFAGSAGGRGVNVSAVEIL